MFIFQFLVNFCIFFKNKFAVVFCLLLILSSNHLYCSTIYTQLAQKSSAIAYSSFGLVGDISACLMNSRRTNFVSGKNIVPFVEPAVDFNAVKTAVEKRGDIPKSASQVKSFCDSYFGGNIEDLRDAFVYTGFSAGFFGAFCKLHQMQYYPKFGKFGRFEKRSFFTAETNRQSDSVAYIRSCGDIIPEKLNNIDNLNEVLNSLKRHADCYRLGKLKIPAFVFYLQRDIIGKMISDLTSTDEPSTYGDAVVTVLSISDNTPNSYFESDLQYFLNKIDDALGTVKKTRYGNNRRFSIAPEVYGVPFCVTYKMGFLQSAYTRNFSKYDTDITDLLRVTQGVPSVTLEKEETVFNGSLFLLKKDFHILNAQRIATGKSAWLDPLQAINFAINSQEPLRVLDGRLRAIFYNADVNNTFSYMQERGFSVVPKNISSIDSMDVLKGYMKKYSEELPFMVSGIRLDLSDQSDRQLLRSSNSFIFKISPEFYEATVESVEFRTQHTGIISAIVNIQSLTISGKHFTKLVLPSKTDFEEFAIGVKDKLVLYSYAGADPRIFTVLKSEKSKKLSFPSLCPKCESPLKIDVLEGKHVACCAAHMKCVDDSKKNIGHFFSKYGLYVASLSERVIDELIKTSTVSSIADVLNLSIADWQSLESVSQDEFSKIINQIGTAKNTTLARFLYALDIPMVSYVGAEKLARSAGSIDRLKVMSLSELIHAGEVTKEVARNVSRFFSDATNYGKLDKLLKLISIEQVSKEIVAMCYKKTYEQSDYVAMIDKIKKCDAGNDTLSDYEYDLLLETVHNIETANPQWILPIATNRSRDLVQWQDSLKLRKTYSRSELLKFCEDHPEGLVVEPKVNGLSCSLQYNRGILQAAFTSAARIEGSGFNIRDFINDVRHIPKQLKLPFSGVVRGELFLSKAGIGRVNDARINAGLQPYVDALSAMGPLTKSRNRKLQDNELYDEIEFFGYHLVCDAQQDKTGYFELATRLDVSNFIRKLGFKYQVDISKVFYSAIEAENYASNQEARRYDFPFDIDGMVVKSLDFFADNEQKNLKYTPDMIGYKFQLQRLKTTLKSVHFSTNQGGVVLATAELEPVKASNGRLISRVSVRDVLRILPKVREGDTVYVDYAGGVSPILQSIESAKKVNLSNASLVELPKLCPVCKAKLHQKANSLQCENPVCFGSSSSKSLQNFARAIGIGKEKNIQKLVDGGIVKKYSDFYRLLPEDLNENVSISTTDSINILSAIENSKRITFGRLLKALKIPGLGSQSIESIVREVKTLKGLLELTKEDVQNNKNCRKTLAIALEYVDSNRSQLQFLLQSGVANQLTQGTNKRVANAPADVDGIYTLYNAQELELAGSVNGVLEKIKRMNSERNEFLQLLAKTANKNSKLYRLEKLLRAAESRDRKLLSEPLSRFLIVQKNKRI